MTTKEKYKISIITPTLNSEKVIESCILSVANQNYDYKEHIIIDGNSTDRTLSIITKLMEKYPHIRYISEKDDGIYDAMNKGISMSSGEWLYFMGSDDVFYDHDVLQTVFGKEDLSQYYVLYGNVEWGNTRKIYDHKFSLLKLMEQNICQQAIFYNKRLFLKIGNFDIKYKILADYVFNFKWFGDDDIKHAYIETVISKYNIDGISGKQSDATFLSERDLIIAKNYPEEYSLLNMQFQKIFLLQQAVKEKEDKIREQEQTIHDFRHSYSWRITFSFRWIYSKLMKLYNIFSVSDNENKT